MSILIDQRHERDRHLKIGGGEVCDTIEPILGRRIEDELVVKFGDAR
ncbi:hypothetical protein [Sphingomonas glacialis]|nr:hypothetical protein [Sphingomonas glacialis]